MNNSERQKVLFELVKKALETVWPDKIELTPVSGKQRDEPSWDIHFHVTRTKKPDVHTVLDCTLGELFQYVAGVVKDYRPDKHFVYDVKSGTFGTIDAVDYTEAEIVERFRPLDAPLKGEVYSVRKNDGAEMIVLTKPSGDEEVFPMK